MSFKRAHLEATLMKEIGKIINAGLSDPRVRGMISVTSVEMSNDMKKAFVYISVLPAEYAELSMHGLKHAARHIQKQVRQKIRTRSVPHFEFHLDDSLKKQAVIFAAINQAVDEDQQHKVNADDVDDVDDVDNAGDAQNPIHQADEQADETTEEPTS